MKLSTPLFCLSICLIFSQMVFAQFSGTLDADFGNNGRVQFDFDGSETETLTGVHIQDDAKIVVTGMTGFGSGFIIAARYFPDGSIDPSFGDDGVVTTDPGAGLFYAWESVLQPDGKILICGGVGNNLFLVRYTTDGQADPSFGNNGLVLFNLPQSMIRANALALQEDGKIVTTGFIINGEGKWDFFTARFLSNGDIDTSFSEDGYLTEDFGTNSENTQAVLVQDDGKILVGGHNFNSGTGDDATLIRYLSDGSRDPDFGDNGLVQTSFDNSDDFIWSLEMTAEAKILLGARSINTSSTHTDFILAQYNADGSLNESFGDGGVVRTNVGISSASLFEATVQEDGKILAAGFASNGGAKSDFAFVRYLADGSLDPSFGNDGRAYVDFNQGQDQMYAMTVGPNGEIYAVGRTNDSPSGDFDALLVGVLGETQSSFSFSADISSVSTCDTSLVRINLSLDTVGGFNQPIVLSVEGLPNAAQVSFLPSAETIAPAEIALQIDLNGSPLGSYPLMIKATTDGRIITIPFSLAIVTLDLVSINQLEPPDGTSSMDDDILLRWDLIEGIDGYELEVATDPGFADANVIEAFQTSDINTYDIGGELQPGVYYWRVRGIIDCGEGDYSPIWGFQILEPDCIRIESEDLPIPISIGTEDTVISQIVVPTVIVAEELRLYLELNHTWVGDLDARLQSPQGEERLLFDRPGVPATEFGCGENHMQVEFADNADFTALELENTCNDSEENTGPPYAISGLYQPIDSLQTLLDSSNLGTWNLIIRDYFEDDGGSLENWALEFCNEEETPPVNLIINEPLGLNAGQEMTISNNLLLAEQAGSDPEDVYYVVRKSTQDGQLLLDGNPIAEGDSFSQAQINAGLLSYQHFGFPFFIDGFTFDLRDSSEAWSPNWDFEIWIIINTEEVTESQLQVYPNPSQGSLTIQAQNINSANLTVEVFDTHGKRHVVEQINHPSQNLLHSFNWPHLAKGVYLLRLNSGNQSLTTRFVIQ